MKNPSNNKALTVSVRVYEWLLLVYPRAHREQYGAAMRQLFRDQCADAWSSARWSGLVWLWLRVLPDVAKTSVQEHFAQPALAFRAVFGGVFVLVFGLAIAVTLALPEAYASRARVKFDNSPLMNPPLLNGKAAAAGYDPKQVQKEFELIQSEQVLEQVIEKLDLNQAWAKKFHAEEKFKTSESLNYLRHMIDLHPARNTSLIDITVYSDDRMEAANIANAISETYDEISKERRWQRLSPAEKELRTMMCDLQSAGIIEHAEPSMRPARPNRPLNISLGLVGGLFLGAAAGGVAWWLARRKVRFALAAGAS